MSETSRWRPISGGARRRMFGLHREPGPDRTGAVGCKLMVLLGVLASSALAVCFVSLMLTKSNFSELIEETSLNSSSRIQSTRTPLLSNVTAPGDGIQETLNRPNENDIPTENYPPVMITQEEKSILEATTGVLGRPEQRTVSDYVESVREGRIVNRRRPPSDHVGAAYSQLPSYGDEYAQLEGYRSPPRGVQEVMSWVETPGVKFTGVYVKAEDKPYLNGHAYVSDPFVRFKPSHPSEINQLAVETDRGTRFSNRPNPQSSPTHTQAIFHPMRPRPLKIMLDVYPMIPEPSTGPSTSGFTEYRRRPQKPPTGPSPNRMIIHLNLYPKKIAHFSRQRPGLLDEELAQERFDEEIFEDEEELMPTTTEIGELAVETATERTEH
ncbi:uncharacterized protein [Halyomorpha halys]|uniref:uncharacterized protein n=1 Tax=Halyomorpha halys TaxID=286706 RepID=UPI0006D4E20A|nr:uncharacterized protein LOC106681336 [Halyomorpha halys]